MSVSDEMEVDAETGGRDEARGGKTEVGEWVMTKGGRRSARVFHNGVGGIPTNACEGGLHGEDFA